MMERSGAVADLQAVCCRDGGGHVGLGLRHGFGECEILREPGSDRSRERTPGPVRV